MTEPDPSSAELTRTPYDPQEPQPSYQPPWDPTQGFGLPTPEPRHLPPVEWKPTISRWETGLRWFLEAVVIVAAAFLLALLIQLFIVKPFAIPSESMEPTLEISDRVLVNRLVYHFREPRRGDVIVFHPPGSAPGSEPFIKRVVAIGGDTVSVHDGKLWVNGVAQTEPYLKDQNILDTYPEMKINTGFVWAMGDNRNNSGDSRVFGPVSLKLIIGRAFCVYWPPGHWTRL